MRRPPKPPRYSPSASAAVYKLQKPPFSAERAVEVKLSGKAFAT
jgi:hypothetical protein